MKVALLQCPGWGRECPPFSLACLSAYVRRHGHEAVCFDLNNAFYHNIPEFRKMWEDKDYYSFWDNPSQISQLILKCDSQVQRYVDQVLATNARVIGFTTHTTSYLVSLEVARRIKKSDSRRIIVFGGPQCSREQAAFPFAKEPCVDAVAVGEGEETLRQILDIVEKDGEIRPTPGLILRWKGELKDCGDRELLPALDELPFPDYSEFKKDIVAHAYNNPKRLEIFDSRGCVRTCHFCSEWQFWRYFRSMSGERMFAEIRHQINEYPQVDLFYFVGSLANGNMKALERFCDLVIEHGLKIRWEAQAIINPGMDRRMLEKMAAAGCSWLGYGVETGSENLRYRMNKKFSNENALMTLEATRRAGIHTQINIMFGQPTETREEFAETLKFLERVRPYIDTVLASQSFCVLDKNTVFYNQPERFGIRGQDHHLFWDSNRGENNFAERFRRYEEFCQLALKLGIPETDGVLSRKPDKWFLLGSYYRHKRDWRHAIMAYRRSLRLESVNKYTMACLAGCYREAGRFERARAWLMAAIKLTPSRSDDPFDGQLRRELETLPANAPELILEKTNNGRTN